MRCIIITQHTVNQFHRPLISLNDLIIKQLSLLLPSLLLITLASTLAHARPLRVLSLPVEASSEVSGTQKPLSAEERLFLAQELAKQLVQSSEQKLSQISSAELTEMMTQHPQVLDDCGAKCPQKLAQLVQADLIIQAQMFRFSNSWRMLVTISNLEGKKLIEAKLKGSIDQIEAQLKQATQTWIKELNQVIKELSQMPLRLHYAQQASPKQTKRWQELGILWLPIKGGKFEMGSMKGHPNERPVHAVEIQDFQMMKTEVTASQYWACVEAGACSPIPEKEGCAVLSALSREAVNCVTWTQAQSFAKWIGARLPTEAEWAKAAKGKTQRTYPWGEDKPSCAYLSHLDQNGQEGCGEPEVQAPCQYAKGISPEGLCDLAGNLWEWVEDDWHRSYQDAPNKGVWCDQDLVQGHCPSKIRGFKTYRGGSWYHPAERARTSARAGGTFDTVSVGIGFRCVL